MFYFIDSLDIINGDGLDENGHVVHFSIKGDFTYHDDDTSLSKEEVIFLSISFFVILIVLFRFFVILIDFILKKK